MIFLLLKIKRIAKIANSKVARSNFYIKENQNNLNFKNFYF
jgi:hypothetical protein